MIEFIETDKEDNHVHQFIKQNYNLQYIQINRKMMFVCKTVLYPFNELRYTVFVFVLYFSLVLTFI